METNIRSATAILIELREGQVVTELSGAIHDALAAVREHNKAADVVLHINIKPLTDTRISDPAITMTARVETKLPKEVPPATIFFVNDDGNPTRTAERPRQQSFAVAASGSQQS